MTIGWDLEQEFCVQYQFLGTVVPLNKDPTVHEVSL